MTLPRLLSAGTSEERRLLRSARADAPSPEFQQRLLISVGIGTLASAKALSAVAAPTQQAAGMGAGAAAQASGIAVLVKWVGIAGLALASGTGVGLVAGSRWAEASASAVGQAPGQSATRATINPLIVREPSDSVHVVQAAATLPLPPPRAPVAVPTRPARDSAAKDSLEVADEVRLIDESRTALRRGDASRCLRVLGVHQRRFPNGVLCPEAALIRIEALLLAGEHDAVRAEGERFLARQPNGPLASRVRAILERT